MRQHDCQVTEKPFANICLCAFGFLLKEVKGIDKYVSTVVVRKILFFDDTRQRHTGKAIQLF